MDKFCKYVNSLPEPLQPVEQQQLLIEYYKTRSEQARQQILEHNLRLTAQKAIECANKYNSQKRIFEIHSECNYALTKALDAYNPTLEKSAPFSHFACKLMEFYVLKFIGTEEKYSLKYFMNVDDILESDDSEEFFSEILEKFHDPNTSRIAEDLISAEFVEKVLGMVSNKNKEIVKMRLGIGYPKAYTQIEIAKAFDLSHQRINQILTKEFSKLKLYLIQNYPEINPYITKKYQKTGKLKEYFKDSDEKFKYITFSYYGIRGYLDKSSKELAILFDTTPAYIIEIKNRFLRSLPEDERLLILSEIATKPKPFADISTQVVTDFYGLNGARLHSISELQAKYPQLPADTLSVINLINRTSATLIAEGKYTKEEFAKIKEGRNQRKREQRLEKYGRVYAEYYGLTGNGKKTQAQVAKMFNIQQENVSAQIILYQKYLDSLSESERAEALKSISTQASQME